MKKVVLKHAIDHLPSTDDFDIVDVETPSPLDGELLLRVVYLSLDPYVGSRLRGRHMGETPPEPGSGMVPGAIVGQIVTSGAAGFQAGDWVHTMEGGWQEFVTVAASHCRKIDPNTAPLSSFCGVLGMPGLTAWAGMTQLVEVRQGDVVLVDAAAGAVGGTAGQLARLAGAARVIGIAGGTDKCDIVTDIYGFDTCIDYKRDDWRDRLRDALPEGLTVFFENVSAEMAMIALGHARPYARGVLCGLVDAYHREQQSQHPINAGMVIGKRARLSGLVVYDFYPRWDEFTARVAPWVRNGQLKFIEDRAEGLYAVPAHFARLMKGANRGKSVVVVGSE